MRLLCYAQHSQSWPPWLSGAVEPSRTTSATARLEGSMGVSAGQTGGLTDPGSGGTVGILGFGSCTYAAAGQH
jgi:hypothetical protein